MGSDDGVGVEVVHRLQALAPPPGVALIDAGTAGMDVMFLVRGAARVVIVDACRSGSTPGAIFRLPGREAMTPLVLQPAPGQGGFVLLPAAQAAPAARR